MGPAAPAARPLRVDPAKVDRLVTLADEMLISSNAMRHLVREAEAEPGAGRELVGRLKDQHAVIERLAREWHEAALRMRMVPVSEVLRRIPRLVRDLARDLGKPADLAIEGEATEADKDVLDALFEPLVHLVRNSMDHGIEAAEERRRAGKPEAARLVLRAAQEGDRILIELADDGRGVDTERLRRQAVQRGGMDPAQAAALTEDEALELVFASGLSTAEALSELSGRGMGMEAVRMALAAAGGTVSLRSRPGEGTTVRMQLPLGLTLAQILTVAVDGQRFAVPVQAVLETAQIPRGRVHPLRDGAAAFALEDRVLPILSLRRALSLPERRDPAPSDDGIRLVVVEVEGEVAGLEVDSVGERLEAVLRPLGGLLAGTPGYLGTTLLGDGQVALVLDVQSLLR